MASVTASPGTIVNATGIGTTAWVNPSNAAASDDSYATATLAASAGSNYLKATNFDFSAIPDGSTINGITAYNECHTDGANEVEVKLVVGGSIVGNNKAGAEWSTEDSTEIYGGAADLWGLTPTAAQVKASDFGIVFAIEDSGAGGVSYIDHIQLAVDYTAPANLNLSPTGAATATATVNTPTLTVAPAPATTAKDRLLLGVG